MSSDPGAEHYEAMCAVVMAIRLLRLNIEDLPAAIDRAQRSLDLGCFFFPTEWRANAGKLSEDLELLRAALPLWKVGDRLRDLSANKPETEN